MKCPYLDRLGDLDRRELERLRLRFLERERLRERLLLLDPLPIQKTKMQTDVNDGKQEEN